MARRKSDSPQKAALREMMSNYMKENDVHIKDGTDVKSIMRDMMSVILEGTLDAEMDEELGYSKYDYKNKETDNTRNGYSPKTMHTSYGDMEINVPRDRKGEFEPQVIKKYQNTVTQDMEEKIISMYAKGMTTADIESHMRDLYDIEISDSTISRITDKILPIVKEWQERPLEEVYAVVFMDAIHYHVRSEGRIVKRAVYIAIGIDMSGKKDVLGMYVGENESAKFWLSIINSLKNRGVEEILITCVDGLTGFPQAIEAVYPHAEIQQCIIHQIRNSTKYVSYKDLKKLMADLKKVYAAPDEQTALTNLNEFSEKWDAKYPKISKSWSEHWPNLATYFKYPEAVRRLIYTSIYMMERFLERLAKSAYAENFIIKGGILITSLVGVSMRSTMDIDTSISGFTLSQEETLRIVTEISEIDLEDGVTFSIKSVSGIMDEMDYPGIRLALDEWLQNRHPMSLSQTSKLFFGRFLLLHTLDYSRYEDDIRNMAVRNGIDLIEVNPAYTSRIAKMKYCRTRKIPVHNGAAYVIARRGQGYKDKAV